MAWNIIQPDTTDHPSIAAVSLSKSGSRALVTGGIYSDSSGTERAQVYDTTSSTSGWTQLGNDIVAPTGDLYARFGYVSRISGDGTHVALASPYFYPDSTEGAVCVYKYNNNQWQLKATIHDESLNLYDSMEISHDGSIVVVSSNIGPLVWSIPNSGSPTLIGANTNKRIKVNNLSNQDDPDYGSKFTGRVSISDDGTRLFCGSTKHVDLSSGVTRSGMLEYDSTNQRWNMMAIASDITDDQNTMKQECEMSGDGRTIVIVYPSYEDMSSFEDPLPYLPAYLRIYKYDTTAQEWQDQPDTTDSKVEVDDDPDGGSGYGASFIAAYPNRISISYDGSLIAIGHIYGSDSNQYPQSPGPGGTWDGGTVLLYQINTSTGEYEREARAEFEGRGDRFNMLGNFTSNETYAKFLGHSVSLNGNGTMLLAAATEYREWDDASGEHLALDAVALAYDVENGVPTAMSTQPNTGATGDPHFTPLFGPKYTV